MALVVTLPGNLPCKVIKWKVTKASRVTPATILALYTNNETDNVKKLKCNHFGTVQEIVTTEGQSVQPGDEVLRLERCRHPTVMKDMCADCGADLREEHGVAGDRKDEASATVAMVHSIPELIVSEELALEIGRKDETRLLNSRKLVLLVDLDQTLLHTTNDNIPPNLKDVEHFRLWHGRWTWYHTMFRPGTRQFLERMSELYELHICTFGVRMYAHTIAGILDPQGKLFSHRILSREECFSANSKTANLKALFPCGDFMVCIIDDRDDVWKYAPNLIQVKPYLFFDGTADINAPPGLATKTQDGTNKAPRHNVRILRVPKNKSDSEEDEKVEADCNQTNVNIKESVPPEQQQESADSAAKSENGKDKSEELASGSDTVQKDECKDQKADDNQSASDTPEESNTEPKLDKDNTEVESSESRGEKQIGDPCGVDDKHNTEVDNSQSQSDTQTEDPCSGQIDKPNGDDVCVEGSIESSTDCVQVDPVPLTAGDNSGTDSKSIVTESSGLSAPDSTSAEPTSEPCVSQDRSESVRGSLEPDSTVKGEETVEQTGTPKEEEEGAHISDLEVSSDSSDSDSDNENSNTEEENEPSVESTKASAENSDVSETSVKKQDSDGFSPSPDAMEVSSTQDSLGTAKSEKEEGEVTSEEDRDTIGSQKLGSDSQPSNEYDEFVVWEDTDDYLIYLEDILKRIHRVYYKMYDEGKENGSEKIPDLKTIIPYVKKKVLKGANILFSGVIPTNQQRERSRAYRAAISLGANIHTTFVPRTADNKDDATTHLIAAKKGTAKVHQVRKHKKVKVVNPDWLWTCAERWEWVDERIFPLTEQSAYPYADSPDPGKPPKKSAPPSTKNSTPDNKDPSTKSLENPQPAKISSRKFSDTINPIYTLSTSDLKDMDNEVDQEILDESDSEDSEAELRRVVLSFGQKRLRESSSEESLAAEYPKGWGKKRRRSQFDVATETNQTEDDLDDENEEKRKIIENPGQFMKYSDQSSESRSSFMSNESVEDELAAALEKEFLSY